MLRLIQDQRPVAAAKPAPDDTAALAKALRMQLLALSVFRCKATAILALDLTTVPGIFSIFSR
jgi:hypothetical protein